MYKVVIMAGGKGERFWPRSIISKPKQFHKIVSERTMIQETFYRLYPDIYDNDIYIVAGEHLLSVIKEQLPEFQQQNLIIEPFGKNTAPAIGLAAVYIFKRAPEATMVVLTADHVIQPREDFLKAVETAVKVAEQGYLVTFGIQPDRPATEYGYIQTGARLEGEFEHEVYRVEMFKEKPTVSRAREFISSGNFLWNSGLFIFQVKTVLEAIKDFIPTIYSGLMKIYESLDTPDEYKVKKQAFQEFKDISIDYAVMEKADNIVCVKPTFLWDDVGSWSALERHKKKDEHGNITEGQVVMLDCSNNIVIGEDNSLISMIGINDAVVVKEGEKLLICHRSQDQNLKDILKIISRNRRYHKFL